MIHDNGNGSSKEVLSPDVTIDSQQHFAIDDLYDPYDHNTHQHHQQQEQEQQQQHDKKHPIVGVPIGFYKNADGQTSSSSSRPPPLASTPYLSANQSRLIILAIISTVTWGLGLYFLDASRFSFGLFLAYLLTYVISTVFYYKLASD